MARSVILGNGSLTVGLNETGHVHDFYYPYVGLDNLTTARSINHRIGVWVNGVFSWTDSDNWESSVDFESDALVSAVTLTNQQLGVALQLQDFVDYELDAFCRIVRVKNSSDTTKEIRVFMHQVFEISRAGRADTALYVPEEHYILDYKGRCMLLVSGQDSNGNGFDQYAVGNYGIEGKQGTFMDAEDGTLSGHTVEHGGVDSVIRFNFTIEANHESTFDYWVAASDTQQGAELIHHTLKQGLDKRLLLNKQYWNCWLNTGASRLQNVDSTYRSQINKSLMVIKAHTDKRGGIIASADSSIYNYGRDYYSYVWPRDGAYAIWPLIRLGYKDEPKAFFRFCKDIITESGYLMHKYQPDRAIGSTWHPLLHNNRKELAIQEDETAIIISMLGEYQHSFNDEAFMQEMFIGFITPAANFLTTFIDNQTGLPHPSYDLWEEKFLSSTYTTAVTYRALLTAADFADTYGTTDQATTWRGVAQQLLDSRQTYINPDRAGYRKGFTLEEDGSLQFDNTLDVSSLYGVITYGYFNDEDTEHIRASLYELRDTFAKDAPSGGIARYEGDNYFRNSDSYLGNPWIITTLWYAQFLIRARKTEDAKEFLSWVQSKALPSGVFSEQIRPDTSEPCSVTPLVWSHAEFINTVLDITHTK